MTKVVYKLGADPEMFLRDKAKNFVSAHNLVPGSKQQPTPVMQGAIQPDGVAAEFNINPATSAGEFSANIISVLVQLQETINQKNKDLQLYCSPTATFGQDYFKKLPHKAKLLGCEPDFDAWDDGRVNPKPKTNKPMRTGAGHLHLGWTKDQATTDEAHFWDCIQMVKQLDMILYPMSLLWDNDQTRRELYGRMGSFRPKSYGVEYRPLSNMWVSDPDLHLWIFEATIKAAQHLDDGFDFFSDQDCVAICDELRAGKEVTRQELLNHHKYLNFCEIPPLPETYLSAA